MYETRTFEDPKILCPSIRRKWEFLETSSAAAVLYSTCPDEWQDIRMVLNTFALDPRLWLKAGGSHGEVPKEINQMFAKCGWCETRVDLVTHGELLSRNHREIRALPPVKQEGYFVDNFKGRVALDVEWNAKDGNLDRDLSAYRAWHEAGVISAAVLITQDRGRLKELAERLWEKHQATLPADQRNPRLPIDLNTSTTTNLEKAALRVRRGVMGTCPLLIVAATPETWNGQPYSAA